MTRAAILALAALVGALIAEFLNPFDHAITQAEVDAFLADKRMQKQVDAFHIWREEHPDRPRTLAFPEVAVADPTMWDFVERTVFEGQKRIWVWSPDSVYVTSSGYATPAVRVYSCLSSSGSWSSVVPTPGYPSQILQVDRP